MGLIDGCALASSMGVMGRLAYHGYNHGISSHRYILYTIGNGPGVFPGRYGTTQRLTEIWYGKERWGVGVVEIKKEGKKNLDDVFIRCIVKNVV
jgi:hypothetical protein